MLWVKKWNFFLYLFSVKKGLEIRLNDVLDRKQTFFSLEKQNISTSQKSHFPKGLTHAFGQKLQFFSLFLLAQNKTRIKV